MYSLLTSCVSTHMPLARHDHIVIDFKFVKMFLLTCLLRGMTFDYRAIGMCIFVSTHMPLARHDLKRLRLHSPRKVSTHMPLARHDEYFGRSQGQSILVSTHMPLARHDISDVVRVSQF